MDAESLVKDLILKEMTPEQQQAILDSVRSSVEQARALQKQKVGENVDLVVQALKKIEADIRSRYDDLGNKLEQKLIEVKSVKDGVNGRDGKDGLPGRDGLQGPQGMQGPAGRDGVDGKDGVSVTNAYIDFDGGLVITLSNGNELNVGEVVPMELASQIKVITNGGGTSQSVLDTLASLQTQINTLIPSQTGNAGKFLTTNGTTTSWATVGGGGGGGLTYQGTWNASTNTPTLASSTGTNGDYYIVATAGSTNLNGITDWQVGDWLLFNGSVWQKIDQTNSVTSVNGQTGAVSLTYTDVNAIGSITSTDGSVTVSTASGVADLSVAVAASTTNVICQVRNTTGATLTKGTVVYISGATGQIPTVSKALANADSTSAQTLGMMSADLANNSNGYVTIIGLITNMDTSAYTDGQQLYLSGTTAGTVTATKPYAPTHLVYVAVVEHAHPTQGKLFVKVQNGYEIDELHNVSAQTPSNAQTLVYNSSTSLWENNTVSLTAGVNGTLPIANGGTGATTASAALTSLGAYPASNPNGYTSNTGTVTSVTGTAPIASSGGNTPAISISQATTSTDGYLSSTDWNTFNNKQAAGTYVTSVSGTTGRITSSGGTTPAIDLASGVVTAGTTGSSSLIPVITVDTYGRVTSVTTASNPQGTVTSVAASVPSFLSVSGSPITSSGTLAITYSGTALPIANGGTGATTSADALTALGAYPSANPSGYTSNTGTVTSVSATVPSIFSISGSPITSSGTLAMTYSGTALPVANGGTGVTTTPTNGQLLIGNGTGYTASTLTAGSNITITNSSGGITIASTGGGATLVFPFYKADGTSDTISLISNSYLPFFNSSGTAKNIALI